MAVCPLRRREDWTDVERGTVETADARERLPQDRLLGLELSGIIEVLPGAAATLRDVWARGHATRGRGPEDLDELGLSIVALVVDDAHASDLSRRDAGDEDDAAVGARDAEDAVSQRINGDGELVHPRRRVARPVGALRPPAVRGHPESRRRDHPD